MAGSCDELPSDELADRPAPEFDDEADRFAPELDDVADNFTKAPSICLTALLMMSLMLLDCC